MESLNKFFSDNFSIIIILAFFWLVVLSYLIFRVKSHYDRLIKNADGEDLSKILESISKKINLSAEKFEKIEKAISEIQEKSHLHLQKVSLVRFNPFSDSGGDQSFAIALLDENNDGLVISNLHSRDYSRVYAKPVKGGEAVKYQFSKEEEEAVIKAKKNK
jgi:hypothetical protein